MKNYSNYIMLSILLVLSNLIYFDLYKSFEILGEYKIVNNLMLLTLGVITSIYTVILYNKKNYVKLTLLTILQILFYIYLIIYVNKIPTIKNKEIIKSSDLIIIENKDITKWKETCLINTNYQYKLPFFNPKTQNLTKITDEVDSFVYFVNENENENSGSIQYSNLHHNNLFYNKNNNEILIKGLEKIIESNETSKSLLTKLNLNDFLNFEKLYNDIYYKDKIFIPIIDGYVIKTSLQHFLLRNINPEIKDNLVYQKINDNTLLFEIKNKNNEIKYKLIIENNLELETKNIEFIKIILKNMEKKSCDEKYLKDLMKYSNEKDDIESFVFYFMQEVSNKISEKERIKKEYIKF